MREDYYYLTKDCIWKKDKLADDYQNKLNYYFLDHDIEVKCDYKKEMQDIKKVQAIKQAIVDASLNFDKLLHEFNVEKPKVLFLSYENYSKKLIISV